jgi:hypothetical protein
MLGLTIAEAPYKCQWCNHDADPLGLHAVTCQKSGAIGRTHTTLKYTFYRIAKAAGLDAELEVRPPNDPANVPADVLLRNFNGTGALAIDFTIVSPVLRADVNHHRTQATGSGCPNRIDDAADRKQKRYATICKAAGWTLQPGVMDTYGAARYDLRKTVSATIKRLKAKLPYQDSAMTATQVWQAMTAAAISRAATPLMLTGDYLSAVQGTQRECTDICNLDDYMGALPTSLKPSDHLVTEDAVSTTVCSTRVCSTNTAIPTAASSSIPSAYAPPSLLIDPTRRDRPRMAGTLKNPSPTLQATCSTHLPTATTAPWTPLLLVTTTPTTTLQIPPQPEGLSETTHTEDLIPMQL